MILGISIIDLFVILRKTIKIVKAFNCHNNVQCTDRD